LDDVLDGHIVSAAFNFWGIENLNQSFRKNKIPTTLLRLLTAEEQLRWLLETARNIKQLMFSNKAVNEHIGSLRDSLQVQQVNDETVSNAFKDKVFTCTNSNCGKQFKSRTVFVKHFSTCQRDMLIENKPDADTAMCTKQDSLIMHLMLLRDLTDAYRMCDGDRVFRNIKLIFLYCFETGHIKYRLWMFRMMAYEKAILSHKKAFEYKWNLCVNMNGGINGNIPDDNLVEIHVKQLKTLLSGQGANVCFQSAKLASVIMKKIDCVKRNLQQYCNIEHNVGHRSQVDKSKDVLLIAQELNRHETATKSLYKDPILKVQATKLHKWLTEQALIAATIL
jgi:hypothetical protein